MKSSMRNIKSPDLSTLLSRPQPHHHPKPHQWYLTSIQSTEKNRHGKSREKEMLAPHAREYSIAQPTNWDSQSYPIVLIAFGIPESPSPALWGPFAAITCISGS